MKKKFVLKKKLEINWLHVLFLIIAGIVNATGVILLLVPAQVIDGGFSGTSVLLASLTHIHISIFLLVLNLPLFFIGYKKLGFHFIIYSCVAILSYSLMSYLYQSVFKISETLFILMKKDVLLASVFGGLVSGIGSGLTIRFGGAIDGIEALAVMVAKKIGLTVGQFVMIYNIIIYFTASILLQDLSIGMYSIISYAVGLKVVDFIVDGFDKGKAFIVVTDKGNDVAKVISKEISRGITVLDSKGYYSETQKTMLYCVVNRFESIRLKKVIIAVDENAFIAINDISEVVGDKVKFKLKAKQKIKFNFNETKFENEVNTFNKFDGERICENQSVDVAGVDFGAINASVVEIDNKNIESNANDKADNGANKTEKSANQADDNANQAEKSIKIE
ncbi:MAG: YitT family protein [Clostridia bacterium]